MNYKLLNIICLESFTRGITWCENKKITLKNNTIALKCVRPIHECNLQLCKVQYRKTPIYYYTLLVIFPVRSVFFHYL